MLLFVSIITKQLNRYLFTSIDMVNKEMGIHEGNAFLERDHCKTKMVTIQSPIKGYIYTGSHL